MASEFGPGDDRHRSRDGSSNPPVENFAHYEILALLGRGGMGVVYKARDVRLGRLVALKFLAPEASEDRNLLVRLRREARAASALNHPGICTVYDVGECRYGAFIAMEFLEGESLRARLRRGPLKPAQITKLGVQLADALQVAHAKGIVHRDVKPENLFVLPGDRLKILDFGLAKDRSGRHEPGSDSVTQTVVAPLTELGVAVGTCAYMSPEQARGEDVDSRSDIFSFGAVLFEMAAGSRAFKGTTAAETCAAVLTQTPVLPTSVESSIRDELQRFIDKALEKLPEFRYQNASEIAADLKRLERARGGHPGAPAMEPRVVRPRVSLGQRLMADVLRAAAVAGAAFMAHQALDLRPAGSYLKQFQLAFVQDSLRQRPMYESDFEAGGRLLPLVVDISQLHPDKRQPTDRALLDLVIGELRRHGATAVGVDLSFDDIQPTDFQYFHRWTAYQNVRVGVYRRAVEKREAWLGRPEFASLAAGIALPPDNPQHAFAYIRRWFPAAPTDGAVAGAPDCVDRDDFAGRCKQDLLQLPVALWLMAEKRRIATEESLPPEELEGRLLRSLESRQPRSSEDAPGGGLEFRTYIIDFSYLRELRREIIRLPAISPGTGTEGVAAHLRAHSERIADRVVLVGDLEDTSDQFCYTPGMQPLPGVLVHASSLATLTRGMMLEPAGSLGQGVVWGFASLVVSLIVGLRVLHTMRLAAWPYQHLAILVFGSLSLVVMILCRTAADRTGVVWPHFMWVSGALAVYPVTDTIGRAFLTGAGILRTTFERALGSSRGG
jgi:predicted Ser/Thr protein kinase